MYILIPIPVTESMLGAGTAIAEPAAGETAWVSGAAHSVGDLRIRTTTHRVYECIQSHTGRTALPEHDKLYWLDKGPTKRHAPFDIYVATAATATGSLTYVINQGFVRDIALYGLVGNAIDVTIKDAPGGTVIKSLSQSLYRDAAGLYEYLFMPSRPIKQMMITDIPLRPTAEITITITGETVGVGMINVGHLVGVFEGGDWGGPEWGAQAEPTTNSYIKVDDDGTATIKRRSAGTNMDLSVVMPKEVADIALQRLQDVIDTPVTVTAVKTDGFAGLNTFGLIKSAAVTYDSPVTSRLRAKIQGMF